jgi:methanogenic corrinoid protein MtbC1
LRAWERRYGVGAARRTESGYRLYDEQAVRALGQMSALVGEGWSVRAAAEEVRRRSAPTPVPVGAGPDDQELVRVAEALDTVGLTAELDRRFSAASFEAVVDGWLLPALRDVGLGWETGRVTVAGEHLVAHGVARRLAAAYDAAGENASAPRVVIGLPPGARHDLGLLAFATAARRAGLSTAFLGADVPVADWVAAVRRGADCAVLAASMPADADAVADVVAAVEAERPGLLIAVGGSRQDDAPAQCLRLGHDVGAAAALLAARL